MSLSIGPLECRVLSLDWKEPLIEFLTAIREANETDYFYPHPFTEDAVEKVILNSRNDLIYILSEAKSVLGYGMLRGWDEGFEDSQFGYRHPSRGEKRWARKSVHVFLAWGGEAQWSKEDPIEG